MKKAAFILLAIACVSTIWLAMPGGPQQPAQPQNAVSAEAKEAASMQGVSAKTAEQAPRQRGTVGDVDVIHTGPAGAVTQIEKAQPAVEPAHQLQPTLPTDELEPERAAIAALLSQKLDLANPRKRAEVVAEVRRLEEAHRLATRQKAQRLGMPEVIELPGKPRAVLVGFDGDLPRYQADHNANAAVSLGTNLVRNTVPYEVNGTGMKLGLWEAGGVPRLSHQEFGPGGRVTVVDGATTVSDHATHVAATILGRGTVPSALGMAPGASIVAYDSANDNSEMLAVGAATAAETNKISISNHSYGFINGWSGTVWFGSFTDDGNAANDIETRFGRYDTASVAMDGMLYNLPYFLPFMSAGNDRNDNPPAPGASWAHMPSGTPRSYDPAQHPAGDGAYKAGYDILGNEKVCKNVITIGAANDAVSGGLRSVAAGTLTSFSCAGPADDGRIKPDVVANGASLYSATSTSDTAYASMSGTSMAAPNASGSALLLLDYYGKRFPGQSMRASTLKALLIHTADDAGRPGPDYEYGWGLMNAKAAADLIKSEADDLSRQQLTEGELVSGASNTHRFVSNGVDSIKVTLCWTDPAGVASSAHDDRLPDVVNNLNVTVTGPSGSVHMPFVMPYVGDWSLASLTSNAITGVNNVDNVEQVLIAAPVPAGAYVVTINHAGSLTFGAQPYSLIITGGEWNGDLAIVPQEPYEIEGFIGGPFAPASKSYVVENKSGLPLSWTASSDQSWLQASPASGTLEAGQQVSLVLSVASQAESLGAGEHEAVLQISNSMNGPAKFIAAKLAISGEVPQISVSNHSGQPLLSGGDQSFGNFLLGSSAQSRILTVSNATLGSYLELESVSLSGPDAAAFTLMKNFAGAVLASGENQVLTVHFSPRHGGAHQADLVIHTNDPAQPVFTVRLSANASAAAGPAQQIKLAKLPFRRLADGPFLIPAVATSGMPLNYAVLAGAATVDAGGFVTPTGSGAVTVQLSQPGGAGYSAAAPVTVTFIIGDDGPQFRSIAVSKTGYSSFGIDSQGQLWSWGSGSSGEMGVGNTSTRYVPDKIPGVTTWKTVSAGYNHVLALQEDGSLWAWGSNSRGELGDGTWGNKLVPTKISAEKWIHVAAGLRYSVAVKADGTLWSWGANDNGQLGLGSNLEKSAPVKIGTASDWASVTVSSAHTLAVKTDGSLWAWGRGDSGQLGLGSPASYSAPMRVGSESNWKCVASGTSHTLALKKDGTLWVWGSNASGQLGTGLATSQLNPFQVGGDRDWIAVDAAAQHSIALKRDGSVWAWGRNREAQMGNGIFSDVIVPVKVSQPGECWLAVQAGISSLSSLSDDGTMVTWGDARGYTGKSVRQLSRAVPAHEWAGVSFSGSHTLLVKNDGTLWGFGYNVNGQVGNGSTLAQDYMQIGSVNSWAKVVAGNTHSGGIQSDGTLWMWGLGTDGQLGDGSFSGRSSPVRVQAGFWKGVAVGDTHTLGIQTDGTLWGWGRTLNGRLGDSTTADRAVPTLISSDTTWVEVAAGSAHTLALKADGSLWACGQNTSGQAGLGTFTDVLALSRVGTAQDWKQISCGQNSSMAIKADGSLWAWGVNSSGQLGLGDTVTRSVPTRVGVENNWLQVAAAPTWTAAIKTDGTLWTWGNNATFQQGVSIPGSVHSPRQVGNAGGWVAAYAGSVSLMAQRADGSLWTAGFSGDFRLTTASGRSPFAKATVLPGLQPQTILPWSEGTSSSKIRASSGLPVELEIVSGPGTVVGDTLHLSGPIGSTVVYVAWQKGDETAWNAALPTEFSITTQSVSFPEVAQQTCGVPLVAPAVASSGLPVHYTVEQGQERVQIVGETMHFVAAGTVTLRAVQPGGSGYAESAPVSRTFSIQRGPQIVSFTDEIPVRVAYNQIVPVNASSSIAGLPVSISVLSGPGLWNSSTSSLSFSGSGDVVLRATQPGNDGFFPASAEVTIASYNTAPETPDISFSLLEEGTVSGQVNATDAEGSSLVLTVEEAPLHGVLSWNPDGSFSYEPQTNFFGTDRFVFKAADELGASSAGTVSLVVEPINDPPVALAQVVSTADSVPVAITLTAEDVDTPSLSFALATQPAKGTLSGTPPNMTYVSQAGYAGTDSFAFRVFDGSFFSSAVVTLQVGPVGVAIVQPPQPAKVSALDRVELTVTATGTKPIQYQWIKDGEDLPGKTQPTLVIDSIEESQAGRYSVRVRNQVDSQESAEALLTVVDGVPEIVVPPAHGLVAAGEEAVLEVSALGRPPLEYQWRKNGRVIAGATGRELHLPNIKLGDAGAYSVVVKGALEAVTSEAAQLGVVEGPGTQVVLAAGGKTAWALNAAGVGLNFAWNRDGEVLSPRATISPDGRKVTLAKAEVEDAGTYACLVTGPGGALELPVRRLVVVSDKPDITPLASGDALPSAIVGGSYSYPTPVSQQSHQVAASFSATGLPPGLKMDSTTGVISGRVTASKPVPYKIKITAKNPVGSDVVEVSLMVDPFPSGAVGTFVAHVPRHEWNDGLGGRLDLVSTTAGSFSGKLTLGSRKPVIIKGGLLAVTRDEGSRPAGTVELAQAAPQPPLTLTFELNADSGHLVGNLEQGELDLNLSGWRSVWHASRTPADAYEGLYNLGLEPAGPTGAADPAGTGYMAAAVARAGTVKLSGKTADGEVLTGSAFLGPQGQVLVHQLMYKSKLKGSMTGTLAIDRGVDADADRDNTLAGSLTWSRPSAPGLMYADGFGPVELRAEGGRYLPPEQPDILLGLAATASNAALRFTGAAIEQAEMTPDLVFQITSRSLAVLPRAGGVENPARVVVKLDARTGRMTGSFTLSDPAPDGLAKPVQRTAPFELLIYPSSQGMRGQGWFLLAQLPETATDSVSKTPRLSGQVRLEAP